MRGPDKQTAQLFRSLSPEAMVPRDHLLRVIRPPANAALDRLSLAFGKLYSVAGALRSRRSSRCGCWRPFVQVSAAGDGKRSIRWTMPLVMLPI